MNTTEPETMALKIYRAASRLSKPVADYALKKRLHKGKEDLVRLNERKGVASASRPAGPLFWIHGASVGESLSVLPLVDAIHARMPDVSILVTTGTVTSAKLMGERLPSSAIHQFIPIDHPAFVDSFLRHWKPNAAIFVESEFWPNLIGRARSVIPFMALINGRISPKSYSGWNTHPNSIRHLLSCFDVIIGQDRENAKRLQALAGRDVRMFGNLKSAANPLPLDKSRFDELTAWIRDRPIWLAASTHRGEEEAIIAAHSQLLNEFPDLLTIIAPRQPDRGAEIETLCNASGFQAARRSAQQPIDQETDIYIANTLGELGNFYRLCKIIFIGGSITSKGGHNPLEPARLGGAILHGPEIFNFSDTYASLRQGGGAGLVRNDRELAASVRRLFRDAKTRSAMSIAAKNVAEKNADEVLSNIIEALRPAMEKAIKSDVE